MCWWPGLPNFPKALQYSVRTPSPLANKIIEALGATPVSMPLRLTAMIFLILMGAEIFSQFLTISRIPFEVVNYLEGLNLPAPVILLFILFALFVLGCFIEGLSIMVITLPILYPLIIEMGYNGIWFGVIMVLMNNIGLLTPPVGVSVFVIKGVAKDVPIQTIFKGVLPMLFAIIVCTVILILWPDLVTYLPSLMVK